MIPQLHVVVWGRSSSTSQPKRGLAESFSQGSAERPIVRLEDTRLVQHDAVKRRRIKVVQHVVVSHYDPAVSVLLVPGILHGHTEFLALPFVLLSNRKRGED